MGLCIDIGHTKRIDRNPEQDANAFFERVFDIYLKDVIEVKAEGTTSIIGRGVMDFPSFLNYVVKLGHKGALALEYKAEGKDPLPGITESVGYVKSALSVIRRTYLSTKMSFRYKKNSICGRSLSEDIPRRNIPR